jgi:outer membrane protein assembly factor BamD
MKTRTILFGLSVLLSTMIFSGCKGEFEKIRTSGDAERLYQASMDYYKDEEYQKAQSLLELIISSYRGKKEAEEIYYKYAFTFYYLGNYTSASSNFKNFTQTFGNSPLKQEADFMSAYSNFQLSPNFRLDQTNSLQAISELQLFINTYPDSERVTQCNELIERMRDKLEEKVLDEGRLYFNMRRYNSAIQSYENLLKDFPETENAMNIRMMIIRSAFLLAENSIYEKRKERLEDAQKRVDEFLRKYPKSNFVKEVTNFKQEINKKLNLFQ